MSNGDPTIRRASGCEVFQRRWQRRLEQIRQARQHGLYHYLEESSPEPGPYTEVGGRRLYNLASNDYLGLSRHPWVIEGAVRAARTWGTGSGGSPLLGSRFPVHRELEARLARLCGKPRAMLFPAGYQGNIAVVSGVVGPADTVFADRLSHASLLDAIALSGASLVPFRHNDADDLRTRLERHAGECNLVIVESIYSMDGDGPDLRAICEVAEAFDALVMVDEAHAIGYFAPAGGGGVHRQGVADRVGLVYGTFGKALGSHGSFVAADRETIEHLQHHSRPYIFSTAPSPAVAGATLAALDLIEREPERVEHLWAVVRRVHPRLRAEGFDIGTTSSPITPILMPARNLKATVLAIRFATRLRDEGVWSHTIVPPAVPRRLSRVRVQLRGDLTFDDADRIVDAMVRAGRASGVLAGRAAA